MSRHEVMLGDHVDLVTGFPFKSAEFEDESEGASRLLRGDNIGQGTLRWDGARFWPASKAADYAAMRLRVGDVVLAMDRPWISAGLKWAVVKASDLPALLVQRVARLRAKDALLQSYLPYVVASAAFTNHVQAITTGVNVPHISGRDIGAFRFQLPSTDDQARIASILSAYDDLIEANRRRVAILEEMARRLFEEWFVHLRFPGHAATPLRDTPDGPVAEGWQHLPLATVANVNQASIRPNASLDDIRYVDIASVSPGRVEHVQSYTFADAPSRARRLVRDGSIIWSTVRPNRRSFALMLDPEPDLVVSTGFAVLDAHLVPASYLYAWTTTDAFVSYLVNHATGSAYPAVNGATFERAQVLVPPMAVADAYDDQAAPMLRLADKLNRASTRLAAARDLLLPRLLSGQLSIAQDHAPTLLAAE